MSKLFLSIYNFFHVRKGVFYVLLCVVLAILLFFASKVQLKENFTQMLPQEKNSEQLNNFFKGSKFTDRIMVCISQKDSAQGATPDSMVAFSDAFATTVKKDLSEYIESIDYLANDSSVEKVLTIIDENLPLFLDEDDYKSMDTLITAAGIAKKITSNYHTLTGPAGIVLKKFILKDPLGLNFIAYKKLKSFQPDEQIQLYAQHFMTADKKNVLLFINPRYPSSETTLNVKFFKKLDDLITQSAGKNFNVIYFGAPVVAAGNATQIRQDSILTTAITLALLILLITLFFRKFSAPILIMLPVGFGALFSMAAIYFLKGEISIIAVAAGSLVLGIAVNYSLHFLTHLRFHPDIRGAIKELSFPMTLGSLTTIGGFLCLQFVKAPVLKDLGLFAALSLIGAALASLILLPHFISKKTTALAHAESTGPSTFDRIFQKLQNNRYFLWMFLLLTPVFLYFAGDIQFENDMTRINYMSPQLKAAEKVVNGISSYYQKSIFVVSKGNSMDAALASNEKITPILNQLKNEGKIKTFSGASTLLLSTNEQQKKIARWKKYWTPEKSQTTLDLLVAEGKKNRFKETAFEPFRNLMFSKSFAAISEADVNTLKEAFLKNFIEEPRGSGQEYSIITLVKTSPENAKEVYSHLAGFPETIVFDRQYITDTLVKVVGQDFNFITLFSSLLVFSALLISYGRIELALITFIPMVISWIWILGIMALIGLKFNIINIILSTLVFGLGDDYAIFTTDGLQQEYARGRKSMESVKVSILFSAITTLIGLGTLVFAKHPALNSIALVSMIGILCVWLASQTLQPVLFRWMITRPTLKGHVPYTLWGLLKSVFAFCYFVFGALLLTVIGIILTKLIPFKKKTMKYVYHWILCKFVASIIYIMANVKKLIIDESNEKFSTPAVVIANHQSFLDILALAMLSPKLILLTNKWVWNSPIFGAVVRMADFYPVAEGAENSLEQLTQRVKEGYSVVVFPEGTRAQDGVIKRFHKGAFFLAEKLQIDILPIILHGTGYCMTKGDFLLKDSQITIKYLPRITPTDITHGANYSERAKLIGRYFRKEYEVLSEQIQTPAYFRHQLINNYLYKGPVLEWYMKVKLRLENNYQVFNELLPKKGKILDLGCGYGFLSFMLGYISKDRTVKGIDYDEDKIETAQHCYLHYSNVSFEQKDLTQYIPEPCDAAVLGDVLHYLQPQEQTNLLEKCINSLQSNGLLIIRDGFKELTGRHKGTRLSEWFSTRIFVFNKTNEKGLSFLSSGLIYDIAKKHQLTIEKIDNSKLTSNVIFVLRKQV